MGCIPNIKGCFSDYFRALFFKKHNYLKSFFTLAVVALLLLTSCDNNSPQKPYPGLLLPGDYHLVFDMDTLTIPAQLHVNDKGQWSIQNWTEQIPIDSITWTDSTFHAKMPLFNTSFSGRVMDNQTIAGKWTDHTREPLYEILFTAKKADLPLLPKDRSPEKLIYTVLFSPDVPLSHDDAIGMFYRYDTLLYGTFLTRSGDHRFLQGRYHENEIMLSGFNGAHLMYYKATVKGDSLIGKYYSGKHYSTKWIGVRNPQAKLQHPDSISKMKNPNEEFTFKVRAENGDSVLFNKENLSGKVSVVQVSGSWCANCTDESRFFQNLYSRYESKGLQIIPVQFERTEDFDAARKQVHAQHQELGLTYATYYGGQAGKGMVNKVFTAIDNITAYPTAIFIDKNGVVRKIHTGFYGPGTGDFYKIHTTELDSFVQMLLNEEGE